MSSEYRRLDRPYPMARVNHREFGPFYQGPVFIWDIDKTYLDTRFSQLKGLLRIPFEAGLDKRAYPGVVSLLQALRDGPADREHRPLYFISASPRQLRGHVEKKMLLDGIEFDGITFKDPLKVLFRGQLDQLKEQVAFKLSALLLLAEELPDGARCHLFGDDAEKDALIYSLFGDVVAGRLRGAELEWTLRELGVRSDYAHNVARRTAPMPPRELVEAIHIHLVRHPDGSTIADFGPHVVGYTGAGAVAKLLAERGLLAAEQAALIAEEAGPSELRRGAADPVATGWLTPPSYR